MADVSRTYVQLKLAALDLKGRRVDAFVVLFNVNDDVNELGRTEVVWSDTSPAFVTAFEIPFVEGRGEENIEYRVVVYNKTSRSDELRRNSFVGQATFTLERVLTKRDGIIERVLRTKAGKSDGKRGRLIICGERVSVSDVRHMYSIQFGFAYNSHVWGAEGKKKARKTFYVSSRCVSLNSESMTLCAYC